jgi:NADPH-dependent curcumin reductase CurA
VFVSTAAGVVGSVVVQLAMRDGMKVTASSGSYEKVQFAKECGANISFSYRTANTEEVLAMEGPIDVCVALRGRIASRRSYLCRRYYGNVGGETIDLAFKYASNYACFIVRYLFLRIGASLA